MKSFLLILFMLILRCNKAETEHEAAKLKESVIMDSVPDIISDSTKIDSLKPRRDYYDDIW